MDRVHYDCPVENLPGYARNLAQAVWSTVDNVKLEELELRDIVSTLEEAWAVIKEATKREAKA